LRGYATSQKVAGLSPDWFLNKYFLTIADNIKRVTNGHIIGCDPANHAKYMTQAFVTSFPKIYFNQTTYKEIESIIRSFKPKHSNGYDEISVHYKFAPEDQRVNQDIYLVVLKRLQDAV
jgi:hypothetical protein